ncbi:MAG: YceI family protein [Actinobacteria bacterium]|nr:YceI family protein [Actinomycetota bacterium]
MTTATASLIPTGTWSVDPAHSTIGFSVKHMGIATVRGTFKEFEGTLEVGDELSAARIRGTVRTASVDTQEGARDEHLRSADFFDAARHPELAFEASKVDSVDEDTFRITGDLTLHGVTREIVLEARVTGTDVDPSGNERVGLEVTGTLSRGDFGMKFNQALGSGNLVVGDKVRLALDISAVRQPA